MKKITYELNGRRVYLKKEDFFLNDTPAAMIYTEDGEPYGNLTVNLSSPSQSDETAFLDENNLPGIGEWVERNGIGTFLGIRGRSGFCSYPLYLFHKGKM